MGEWPRALLWTRDWQRNQSAMQLPVSIPRAHRGSVQTFAQEAHERSGRAREAEVNKTQRMCSLI